MVKLESCKIEVLYSGVAGSLSGLSLASTIFGRTLLREGDRRATGKRLAGIEGRMRITHFDFVKSTSDLSDAIDIEVSIAVNK